MSLIREYAPAKINLTLEVLGKRSDGYHELRSLVAFADVGDELVLDFKRPSEVTTEGPFAASIAGANLVQTALAKLAAADPSLRLGAVTLKKNLPVAAGIGGGSADAAALIRLVMSANPDRWSDFDWDGFALGLGADVPVCLAKRLSWMCGLGELVAPLALAEPLALQAVIVNPLLPVPADKTAQVFRALRASPLPENFAAGDLPEIRTPEKLLAAVRSGHNSLEAPCRQIVPAVGGILQALASLPGATLARMSGGGPTCFALFATSDAAHAAATSLSAAHPEWWVRAVVLN
jgi:4-diphosphocytidyl-2-C-methyl-D-erythritol kinase